MRVVVTGATGNVGTSVVEALAADPGIDEVVGVARRAPDGWSPPKTRFVEADVGEDDLSPLFDGADAVVHLAWRFQPTHDPLVTWNANAVGSIKVFEAAARAGVRTLIHASSIGAYSPAPGRTVDETWPTHSIPTAAYGREKAYVERALDAFEARHSDIRVVRFRPAFIFKREAASEQRRIFAGPALPRFWSRRAGFPWCRCRPGSRSRRCTPPTWPRPTGSPSSATPRGAFNLAGDPVIDDAVIAEVMAARVVELPRRVVRAAVAAGWHLRFVPADPSLLDLFLDLPIIDSSRAYSELGWKPVHSAQDALTRGGGGHGPGSRHGDRAAPSRPIAACGPEAI